MLASLDVRVTLERQAWQKLHAVLLESAVKMAEDDPETARELMDEIVLIIGTAASSAAHLEAEQKVRERLGLPPDPDTTEAEGQVSVTPAPPPATEQWVRQA